MTTVLLVVGLGLFLGYFVLRPAGRLFWGAVHKLEK